MKHRIISVTQVYIQDGGVYYLDQQIYMIRCTALWVPAKSRLVLGLNTRGQGCAGNTLYGISSLM